MYGLAVPCAWSGPVLELGKFSGSLCDPRESGRGSSVLAILCDECSPASVFSGQGALSCFLFAGEFMSEA